MDNSDARFELGAGGRGSPGDPTEYVEVADVVADEPFEASAPLVVTVVPADLPY